MLAAAACLTPTVHDANETKWSCAHMMFISSIAGTALSGTESFSIAAATSWSSWRKGQAVDGGKAPPLGAAIPYADLQAMHKKREMTALSRQLKRNDTIVVFEASPLYSCWYLN